MGNTTSTRCSFLELPAELRNRIYREVLHSPSPITIKEAKQSGIRGFYPRTRFTPPQRFEPALLQTSRQIRSEATSIYYGENEFQVNDRDRHGAPIAALLALRKFLQMLGPERRGMLKCVIMDRYEVYYSKGEALLRCIEVESSLEHKYLELSAGVLKLKVAVDLAVVDVGQGEIRQAMDEDDWEDFEDLKWR